MQILKKRMAVGKELALPLRNGERKARRPKSSLFTRRQMADKSLESLVLLRPKLKVRPPRILDRIEHAAEQIGQRSPAAKRVFELPNTEREAPTDSIQMR